jgi:orotate phosphoribosyltransferase
MAKEIAKSLLDIEAVTLSPNDLYTWSSGIKSPIYCDNRVTLGYPFCNFFSHYTNQLSLIL